MSLYAPSTSKRQQIEQPVLLGTCFVALTVPILAALGAGSPLRTVLTLAGLLVVPGAPVAVALRLSGALTNACLAIGVSLASWLLLSTAMEKTGLWHPLIAQFLLSAVTLVASTTLLQRLRSPDDRDTTSTQPLASADLPGPSGIFRRDAVLPVALVGAFLLWLWSARSVNLDAMGPLGLVSVLDWRFGAALFVWSTAAALELTRPRISSLRMALVSSTLVVLLFAYLNVAEGTASFPTGWVHAGFISHLDDVGTLPSGVDARFSWPGFFGAASVAVDMAGLQSATRLLTWAPTALNLLAMPSLLLIARRVCSSERLAWAGVLLFYCGNWYQQDYFSPQAVAFLLYLVVVALMLTASDPADWPTPPISGGPLRRFATQARRLPPRRPGESARQVLGLEVCLALMGAAMVVSHQITPVALIISLAIFALLGTTRFRGLWLLASIGLVGWFSYGAVDYWSGHLNNIFGDVGAVGTTLASGVGERVSTGDEAYQRAQLFRLAVSAAFAAGGVAGLLMLRRRRDIQLLAGLAYAPFSLVLLNSYGGEVMLRAFLLAMPFLAPLTATAMGTVLTCRFRRATCRHRQPPRHRRQPGPHWMKGLAPPRAVVLPVAVSLALFVLAIVLTAARGVNAPFERVTPDLVAASEELYERVPEDGADVGALQYFALLGYDRLRDVRGRLFNEGTCATDPVPCIEKSLPPFVIVSSSDNAYGVLKLGQPEEWTNDVVDTLVRHGHYYRVFNSEHAQLLQARREPGNPN